MIKVKLTQDTQQIILRVENQGIGIPILNLAILNQISELHHLLTPENLNLICKFYLLENKTHD